MGNTAGPTTREVKLEKVAVQTLWIPELIIIPLARYMLRPELIVLWLWIFI